MTTAPQRLDTHQHFWRYQPQDYAWISADMAVLRDDFLPAHARAALQPQGFTGAIAVQARASEAENAFLLALAESDDWVRAVIGWVDLLATDAPARIAFWLAQPTMRGFRPMLQDEPDLPALLAHAGFHANVQALQAQGGLLEVLLRGAQLAHAPALCARHDGAPLVLDHIGKPAITADTGSADFATWRGWLQALGRLPHVSVKLSGLVTEVVDLHAWRQQGDTLFHPYLDTVLDAFGPERLMFGSDWPVALLAADGASVTRVVRDWAEARLTPAEQASLWGDHARHLYRLD